MEQDPVNAPLISSLVFQTARKFSRGFSPSPNTQLGSSKNGDGKLMESCSFRIWEIVGTAAASTPVTHTLHDLHGPPHCGGWWLSWAERNGAGHGTAQPFPARCIWGSGHWYGLPRRIASHFSERNIEIFDDFGWFLEDFGNHTVGNSTNVSVDSVPKITINQLSAIQVEGPCPDVWQVPVFPFYASHQWTSWFHRISPWLAHVKVYCPEDDLAVCQNLVPQ